jgi:5-hydroxyisourate hydrolase-like protein (transthyretin family)
VISTHVLDTELGEPAAGMKVGLFRGKDLISLQETDEDGRIPELADVREPGEYRLVFSAPHRADRLYVGGEEVVREGRLVHADEEEIARHHRVQAGRLAS